MFRLLLKKQWRGFLLPVLLFCAMLSVRTQGDAFFEDRYDEVQAGYIAGADPSCRQEFFEKLDRDLQNASEIVQRIEDFADYEGEIPEEEIDPVLSEAGGVGYFDYDMIVWRQEMLQMPGRYTASIGEDERMLFLLSSRMHNQQFFSENLENNKEIMRRGLRRGDDAAAKYQAVLTSLDKISGDFAATDPHTADKLFSYLESDGYVLILLTLSCFALFSSVIQQQISRPILSSRMNVRRYTGLQMGAALCLGLGSLLVYWTAVLLIFTSGDLSRIPWELPIQAINGYEQVAFALSVWQYFLILLGLKLLCCLFTALLTMGISLLTGHTVLSGLCCTVYLGSLLLLSRSGSLLPSLLLGNVKSLFRGLPYLQAGEVLVSQPLLYALGMLLLSGVTLLGILVLAKPAFRRRVSA